MAHDPREVRVLIVEDDRASAMLLHRLLVRAGYEHIDHASSADAALALCRSEGYHGILLDLHMREDDGFRVLQELGRRDFPSPRPHVLVITGSDERDDRLRAFELGARDFVGKPYDPTEILVRIRNLLDLATLQRSLESSNAELVARLEHKAGELRATRLEVIRRLGRAAEYRDHETGQHILRLSHMSGCLAESAGFDSEMCDLLVHASPMHDVGKIGIPDRILQKPGPLDPGEWEIMKRHTVIGAELLAGDSPLMTMGARIALHHHEHWDGTGYPHGLSGQAIPVEARIVAVCDVFDALTSDRPYKRAWPIDEARRFVLGAAGRKFDPALVADFDRIFATMVDVRAAFADPDADSALM